MQPTRILIVAENASTRFGGEAILPYHYFRLLLARNLDVHLIVHARTRDELLTLFPHNHARLHFVEDQPSQKLFFRIGKLLPHRIAESTFGLANQLLTQSSQRRVARSLVIAGCVIHQPIPVSPRFPSLLYDLGAPVVIGPLNGGMEFPPAFRGASSWFSNAIIALGRSLTNTVNAIFPGKRRAAIVLVANARTRAALPAKLSGKVLELPENAVDSAAWTSASSALQSASTRFIFIGRLVDWKALDIVLDALPAAPSATLDIIGDGPMLARWQQHAHIRGVAGRVRFLGWRTQAECAAALADACALVLPSLYECGGAVVLEAMAMQLPVIATAWGGPADYLDATCGILIEPTSRNHLVEGFARAMNQLIASPETRRQMGISAQARQQRDFDWLRKIDRILEVYAAALNG